MAEITENKTDKEVETKEEEERISDVNLDDRSKWDYDFYLREKKMKKEPSFKTTLVISNLPRTTKEKSAKLASFLKKRLSKKYGELRKDGVTILFQKGAAESSGLALARFKTIAAVRAATQFEKFDKAHRLTCVCLADVLSSAALESRIRKLEKACGRLEGQDFDLFAHNRDSRQRSMYVLREGAETKLLWNDPLQISIEMMDPFIPPGLLKEKHLGGAESEESDPLDNEKKPLVSNTKLTDSFVVWSPSGKYLAAVAKKKNVELWAGLPLRLVCSFEAENISTFSFSPKETFILTRSPDGASQIWDYLKGCCLEKFQANFNSLVKWSFDDRFFAFMCGDDFSIYSTETMSKIQNTPSQKTKSFDWAPDANLLAVRSDLQEGRTKFELLELPEMTPRIAVAYHENANYAFSWNMGRLVLRVQTFTLKMAPKHIYFDFFDYTGETVIKKRRFAFTAELLKDKGHVEKYPTLNRADFSKTHKKVCISYSFEEKMHLAVYDLEKEPKAMVHFHKENTNAFFWAPDGDVVVAAGLCGFEDACNGLLLFIDTRTKQLLARANHYGGNAANWSPCGRYFVSIIQASLYMAKEKNINNGFNLYTPTGTLLKRYRSTSLYQLLWRPRARILPNDQIAAIKAHPEAIREKYLKSDDAVKSLNRNKEEREREAKEKEYAEIMAAVAEKAAEIHAALAQLRSDLVDEEMEETVEIEVEVRIDIEKTENRV